MGYAAVTAATAEQALELCGAAVGAERPFAAIITDLRLGGASGLELFEAVRGRGHTQPVIMITAFATIESAVEAMKRGAFDYLVKPFSREALEAALRRALAPGTAAAPTARALGPRPLGAKPLVTRDPEMQRILKMARVVAASQATVLIEGESGTGKEVLARLIHEHSPRAHRPFVGMNCAAVPESLLESELFGYEKGAFTGAASKKPGRFELAHTGTLLLDEVSEMHLSLQTKLLRVLQEREVDPLGGKTPVALDIRVIATTNRPLAQEVAAGRFREDLYYRLNVFPLCIPPLRDRLCDVPALVEYFLHKGALRHGQPAATITPEALARLMSRSWRGNVRELENAVERAGLLCEDGVIRPEHLLPSDTAAAPRAAAAATTVWEAERDLILTTLERVGGNRTRAARLLGISIRTLRNKLRAYRERGLPPAPLASNGGRREGLVSQS